MPDPAMNPRPRVRTGIVVILVTGMLVLALALVSAITLTPDSRLEKQLRSHKASFERLVLMMQEDRALESLRPREISPRWDLLPGFTVEREAEYLRLMKQAGVQGVFRVEDGAIAFSVSSVGMTGSACYKGIAYSRSPLSPLEPSLHKIKRATKRGEFVYKKLGEGWHLYLRCV